MFHTERYYSIFKHIYISGTVKDIKMNYTSPHASHVIESHIVQEKFKSKSVGDLAGETIW